MFSRTHLSLKMIRLKPQEKWTSAPNQIWFVFPKDGDGQYVSPRVKRALAPGDVLVVDSTCESEVRPSNGSEFVFCCFSVFPEHIFPLFSSNEMSLLRNLAEEFKTARLHSFDTAVAQECHRLLLEVPSQPNLNHRGQLLRVVAAVLEAEANCVQPNLPGFVRAEDHLLQVLEEVSGEDLMNLSVGELAAKFGWSKRHLNRMFHTYFGLSAAALKMEMRLLRAVSLLRDPDVKIISVAESCGFNYLGFFNACFKKRFGVTPTQHRKLLLGVDNQGVSLGVSENVHICPLRSLGLACQWAAGTRNQQPAKTRNGDAQRPDGVKIVVSAIQPACGRDDPRRNLRLGSAAHLIASSQCAEVAAT